ncbi:hypothetical protein JVU11DRAFT_7620 [Chiua virens]|nr:hypothetical protein JVU11DRAFT_7620 [Chiua virens]
MFGWLKAIFSSSSRTYQLNDNDIVVFVVGPAGGGKSWFTKAATNSPDIAHSASLTPNKASKGPVAIRCKLNDPLSFLQVAQGKQENIVFVDIPSLDDECHGTQEEIKRWLKKSKAKSTHVGVIYVDRLETDPKDSSRILRYLDLFDLALPPGFTCVPERLHGVLSFSDKLDSEKRKRHWEGYLKLEALDCKRKCVGKPPWKWNLTIHRAILETKDHADTGRNATNPVEPDEHATRIAWDAVKQLLRSS